MTRTSGPTFRMAACAAFLLLAGCITGPVTQPGPVTAQSSPQMNQDSFVTPTQAPYSLRPTDEVSVTVFREPDLSIQNVSIGADGTFSMPLLGSIDAVGLTADELARFIRNELGSRYLKDPQVSVNITKYTSHRVTVEGAVKEPGLYEFQPGTRLSGGIALASGTTREAQIKDIAVFRDDADGMQVAKFDLAAMRAGTMPDPYLQPGDRIVVGTNNLTQLWQDLLKALPAFGLFTRL